MQLPLENAQVFGAASKKLFKKSEKLKPPLPPLWPELQVGGDASRGGAGKEEG